MNRKLFRRFGVSGADVVMGDRRTGERSVPTSVQASGVPAQRVPSSVASTKKTKTTTQTRKKTNHG